MAKKPNTPKTSKPADLPEVIYAQASPHSIGGVSMFDADGQIRSETVANFQSEPQVVERAVYLLQDAGFQILQITPTTINIAGPPRAYEQAFEAKLFTEERDVLKPCNVESTATFIESPTAERPGLIDTGGSRFAELLEGVAIEEPVYPFAANPMPPARAYWHLDVPAGVSLGCNADRAHRGGTTGAGVRVAMCDSGHFAHPFFAARGYRVAPVVLGPAAANPTADENGHGTAESANIFAVAPDAQLLPVKMSFVNSNGGFNAAVGLAPDIITCSWGSDVNVLQLSAANIVLATSVAAAVASGIIVIFSAGNGQFGFPGQHPDVISVGGVFLEPGGGLRASDYASGFASVPYPGRNVPDLCGLVGMLPKAAYIMLPLQEGCQIDMGLAGGAHPNGDETANNDGWAAISGTSAAAPQLAGVAALMKQACPRLTPAQIRSIMVSTARDVTVGRCHPRQNNPAGPGSDLATGSGLVDAHRAVLVAKLRCSTITPPIGPIGPVQPVQPVQPIRPPIGPIQPIQPIRPPIGPIPPIQPIRPPIGPFLPQQQPGSFESDSPERTPQTLSEDDIQALERFIGLGGPGETSA